MKYIIKNASTFSNAYSFKYEKPATCPFCGYGTDATFNATNSYKFNSNTLLTATCECTSCHKLFFFCL